MRRGAAAGRGDRVARAAPTPHRARAPRSPTASRWAEPLTRPGRCRARDERRVRRSAPSSGHWSVAFDAMNDMVCLLARDGTVAALQQEHGGPSRPRGTTKLIGKKCYELMHGSHTFFEKCPCREILHTREARELRAEPLNRHWCPGHRRVRSSAVAEEIVGAVHVVRDVTEAHTTRGGGAREKCSVAGSHQRPRPRPGHLPRRSSLGAFLAGRLRELTGAVAVAFSEYDPEERVLATRAIEFQPGRRQDAHGAALRRRLRATRSPVERERLRGRSSTARTRCGDAHRGQLRRHPAGRRRHRRAGFSASTASSGIAYVIEGCALRHVGHRPEGGRAGPAARRARDVRQPRRRLAAQAAGRGRAGAADRSEVDQLFAPAPATCSASATTTGILLRVNPAWETTLGYPVAELEGRPTPRVWSTPTTGRGTLAGLGGTGRRASTVTDFVNRQRHRDGSYRLVEWRITPLRRPAHVLRRSRDYREGGGPGAEEARRREWEKTSCGAPNAYNRSLIEASLDPLVTIGPDGKITDVNRPPPSHGPHAGENSRHGFRRLLHRAGKGHRSLRRGLPPGRGARFPARDPASRRESSPPSSTTPPVYPDETARP